MQVGNIGKGNSASSTILEIVEAKEEEESPVLMSEGCTVSTSGKKVTATMTGEGTNVWDAKFVYNTKVTLEVGKKYNVTFKVEGEHGVGEFFLLKSDDINNRFDNSFTNAPEERTVTITATGTKLYAGMQIGNIGKGNSASFEIIKVEEAVETENPTHVFADTWSHDEFHHWHACKDEGCSAVSDFADHTYGAWKADGGNWFERSCTDCGRVERVEIWQENGGLGVSGTVVNGELKISGKPDDEAWHIKMNRTYEGLTPGREYRIVCKFTTTQRGNVKLEVGSGAYNISGDFAWANDGENTWTVRFTAGEANTYTCLQLGSLGFYDGAAHNFDIIINSLSIQEIGD